jgi:glutamate-1-semialdehyde 2,1-aminomutase
MNYSERLHKVIPGGAHTYSRGDDQYPSNAPQILERGEGAYVYTPEGEKYLDYGMALRAVTLGYSDPRVNQAAIDALQKGNNLTRASLIELEAAELLVNLVDSVDMVKFTKNGSTATSAAVKLARAYTGRELIARCAQHPFFSYDDWFIGTTPITSGIPKNIIQQTKMFNYNDIKSLEVLEDQFPGQISCVILEPAAMECPSIEGQNGCCSKAPCTRKYNTGKKNFLQEVQEFCKRKGIVFILDEMITGFRWHLKGAQHVFQVEPDLCTFGKGMANGFSVAAVAGKREIMSLGSTDTIGKERLFLLSTTHGAEMSGLGAFIKTMEILQKDKTIEHLWDYGAKVVDLMNNLAQKTGASKLFKAGGPAVNPYYLTYDKNGNISFEMRTLFAQEMINAGILIPWLAFSACHGDKELEMTSNALEKTFKVLALAAENGVEKYLKGRVIKPVFRTHN